jgi:hypothetical protein
MLKIQKKEEAQTTSSKHNLKFFQRPVNYNNLSLIWNEACRII